VRAAGADASRGRRATGAGRWARVRGAGQVPQAAGAARETYDAGALAAALCGAVALIAVVDLPNSRNDPSKAPIAEE
jgi:hypothetical protein